VVGDQVLQELARRLQSELREVDILGRYGGEEFLIILLETDLEVAVQAAGRLRLHAAQPLKVVDGLEISITVSIGAAAIQDSTRDLAALIASADAALYDAKRAGRNRVASR
jgi:diguanylate cyclase (GGDEF)-like protein